MKVVLNQDVKGVGKKLQIVEVSEGYARNFLLPRKLANIADNKNISEANTKSEALKFKKKTEYDNAVSIKEKIENKISIEPIERNNLLPNNFCGYLDVWFSINVRD